MSWDMGYDIIADLSIKEITPWDVGTAHQSHGKTGEVAVSSL